MVEPTVNRPELVELVSKRTSIPAGVVSEVFRGLGEELVDQMRQGRTVSVQGVAKMTREWRAERRSGRNIRTGRPQSLPARWVAQIVPGSRLKAAAAASIDVARCGD